LSDNDKKICLKTIGQNVNIQLQKIFFFAFLHVLTLI